MSRDDSFVRRRVGFKMFMCLLMTVLCTGVWVLRSLCVSNALVNALVMLKLILL